MPSARQHLATFIVDDRVSFDAGSLGQAATSLHTQQVRDVVLTHAHLDHIAGLPLFIDDLFSQLREPLRIHATAEVIETLETHIFNWRVYPRFSELRNAFGPIVEYIEITPGVESAVGLLKVTPVEVNHRVPAVGFVISDARSTIALTGDTAEMDNFWEVVNRVEQLDALLVECAFPNEMEQLALTSCHMTPARLGDELGKFRQESKIYVINIKPSYREETVRQLDDLHDPRIEIFAVGKEYDL